MRSNEKAHAHLQSAIEYLRFGMDQEYQIEDTEERQAEESDEEKKNAEHQRSKVFYGIGAPNVGGIIHFAEITNLTTLGPKKVFCVGEVHGLQKSDVNYITQYEQLLTKNDQ